MSDVKPTVNEQILALLRKSGPLSMGKIAVAIGKNVGGVRQRLLMLEVAGRVGRFGNEHGSQWFVPDLERNPKEPPATT